MAYTSFKDLCKKGEKKFNFLFLSELPSLPRVSIDQLIPSLLSFILTTCLSYVGRARDEEIERTNKVDFTASTMLEFKER